MSSKVYSVSQLNQEIRVLLETNFRYVSVQGEISNLKKQPSGHIYFSLKDKDAQVSSVLFRGYAQQITRSLKEGDQIVVQGELGVYSPRGTYQIIVRNVEFVGDGELLLQLHRYKEELKKRGWLAPEHKKPLPKFPKKIGIITSPTGAVIQDILHVLNRRFSGFKLLLHPVKVQGPGSKEEIAQAIQEMNTHQLADVLIVGRGGGSIEDLWAFNEPIVAEAIFHSKIPIISAVGHEIDYSISDLVADVRAPTPSAAAEIVTKEKKYLLESIETIHTQISKALLARLSQLKIQIKHFENHPALRSPYYLLGKQMQRLDEIKNALHAQIKNLLQKYRLQLSAMEKHCRMLKPSSKIIQMHEKIDQYQEKITLALKQFVIFKKQKLETIQSQLKAVHPKKVLKRGYSLLYTQKDKSLIFSQSQIKKGEKIIAELYDGRFEAEITNNEGTS